MKIDRAIFFEYVRQQPFGGKLTQQQVDGMEYKLAAWEERHSDWDLRWLANCLAQCYHETGAKMWPISEYGKGGSASYAKPDPTTKQAYYGRGDIQLTWKENYQRADRELGLTGEDSCYLKADNQLRPEISAPTMFLGMSEGWFRTNSGGAAQKLALYFNDTRDDPYNAREIINGDKTKIPSWSGGVSIGNLIVGYHNAFLKALQASAIADMPEPVVEKVVTITIDTPEGVRVDIKVNGLSIGE